ncbi:Na(+)-translocating NADH-quinone reductase subunit A [Marinilabilia rubra]|uniref:Na(+)-translocating NADH-quinone reductase subunit A n=1 Tax=Marinilabilia rubra TaxID=2162893 RepID=A0A2U2BA58_9BACT|nr:Na(+)-translocating NADH-quinone reductase subunit A [Marinilabilia rubra]PWD99934.1 NADH:ubiquinone reductase (Na(+)-transporting) subunit A [Marinilabilia rubra]
MSEVIKIKKGLDIRLKGKADNVFSQAQLPDLFAIKPTDFHGVVPKMVIKEGEKVKAGSVLFFDKYQPDVKFVSPVSGELTAVIRGERRKILEVVVKSDGKDEAVDFGVESIADLSREAIVTRLQEAGAWAYLRQRPYDIIARTGDTPKAIFISGFDTAPLAPDFDFVMTGKENEFQAGIDILKKLSDNIHIGVNDEAASKVFTNTKGVELHRFKGPHPAGNVGIQIGQVMPINKGDLIWTIQPQEVASIGKLFTTGKPDFDRTLVVAGSEVKKPAYFHSRLGACVEPYIKDNLNPNENVRLISGNVLTGSQISDDGYVGFYHSQITAIPEGDEYEFMGWAAPGFNKFSVSRSFFSWLRPNKRYRLNANMQGGKRAIVVSGEYDKVLPMDILPEQLIKSILVEDIDKMEQLGIYELAEEDLALCEFVCTSKLNLQKILRDGIDLMIKELG